MSNTALTIAGGAATPGGLASGFYLLRKQRLIQDLPTSKTAGVVAGLNEVKGVARVAQPLASPLSGHACVYFSWSVSEHYRRTETYQEDGETKTRTTEGWETVASDSDSMPFELVDDTGAIWVHPEGADVTGTGVFSESGDWSHPLWHFGGSGSIYGSTGRRRFEESVVPLDVALFVLANARLAEGSARLELARADGELFVISVKSEEQITSGLRWGTRGLFTAATVGAGTAAAAAPSRPNGVLIVGAIAAVGLVIALFFLFSVYNALVRARDRTRKSWANVETELQRRHDLIPNLVAVVKQAAAQEAATLTAVTAAATLTAVTEAAGSWSGPGGVGGSHSDADVSRASAMAQQQTAGLATVLVTAERYPQLKANSNYQSLTAQLVETENRLALSRQFFNDAVEVLSNRVQRFPGVIFGRTGRFPAGEYFAARAPERSVPVAPPQLSQPQAPQ